MVRVTTSTGERLPERSAQGLQAPIPAPLRCAGEGRGEIGDGKLRAGVGGQYRPGGTKRQSCLYLSELCDFGKVT